jgi:hypothetical protein
MKRRGDDAGGKSEDEVRIVKETAAEVREVDRAWAREGSKSWQDE